VQPQGGDGEQDARRAGHEKRAAPAEVHIHLAGDEVAERGAERNDGVEDPEHPAAGVPGIVVGQQAGRDRAVGRLADPDEGARDEQAHEAPRQPAEHGGDAPDRHAEGDEPGTGAGVAGGSEQRGGQHVDHDEATAQDAELGVADAQGRVAQRLAQKGEDVAVEVVAEVDEREHQEPRPGRARHSAAFVVLKPAST